MSDDPQVVGSKPVFVSSLPPLTGAVDANEPVLGMWANGLALNQRVHFLMAERCQRRDKWLGVPALVLTTVVGTALFATLESKPETRWQIVAGLLSIAASILVALQTFMNYGSRAASHVEAAAGYGELRRLLEQERLSKTVRQEALTEIRLRWSALDAVATPTSKRLRKSELKEIKKGSPSAMSKPGEP